MRYITATELQNWQKTRQSEEKLPLLLRRLIINLLEFKNINFIVDYFLIFINYILFFHYNSLLNHMIAQLNVFVNTHYKKKRKDFRFLLSYD